MGAWRGARARLLADKGRRCVVSLSIALTALLTACGDGTRTPAPSPLPSSDSPAISPPPFRTYSVSGVVYAHTPEGIRPLAGLRFQVWWSIVSAWDLYPGPTLVVSAQNGSYTATTSSQEVSLDLVHVDIPYEPGFHAPCPPGLDALAGDARLDIHVVPDRVLSSSGMPVSVPITGTNVRGRVVERTKAGVRPVGGAAVRLVSDTELLRSSTLSDGTGKFLLCSNVSADRHTLQVNKDGYRPDSRSVFIGDMDSVTVEIVRE
jgi:hypothetical protein